MRAKYYLKKFDSLLKSSATAVFFFITFISGAQTDSTQDAIKLSDFSLEELMNVEVTSISMRPEKITEVASAVQVITGEDIHRSSATRLPEALRLASNLQIAQANSHDWAITARGFNGLPSAGGILANKLLVMIDGRLVYNPLFGGVYWDVQNTMLKDLDRIEVVSGPGGTLWGANAVNGVINVVTKSAKETQGLYLSGTAGTFINSLGSVRVGGRSKVDTNLYYRIYAQNFDQRSTLLENGTNGKDAWNMMQGGFRMDYYPSKKNNFTLQGDVYGGGANKDSLQKYTVTDGQNVLARFTHVFSERSDLKIQAYADRTWRATPRSTPTFFYSLNTYDIDLQHRFSIGKRQSVLWGAGYRLQEDKTPRSFVPLNKEMPLYNFFIQDEVFIIPERLKFIIGSKFLHNVFTGFEYQPSARIAWTPNKKNTIWASVSRAVRTPSRFDADITVTDLKFKSEKVFAYELGYRFNFKNKLALSFATFYNHYNDLRSLDITTDPNYPIIIANSQRAESWGFEFNGTAQLSDICRIRGGYTYFGRNIWAINSSSVLTVSKEFESVDPANVFIIQTMTDITKKIFLDVTARYVDILPEATFSKNIPAYFTFDARAALKLKPFEISVVGQNLLEEDHIEVGRSKIPRTVYIKLTCEF